MKKKIPIIAVNALFLLAFFACLIASASIRGTLRSQQAARTWAGQSGERFAQLSVFIPDNFRLDEEAIHHLRAAIDTALVAASLEDTDGRTLYTDAWAAVGEVIVVGDREAFPVEAFGVGGDFFLFRPLHLRDGSYISPNDLMRDRVVLDEELAWRLFGSVRVTGMEIMIGDRPHTVAGVIARDTDFATVRAYGGGAGMFMSYESLRELTGGSAGIGTYMIVLPDPITGFALETLTEAFPAADAHIVENSARYSLSNTFNTIAAFGERSMRTDGIVFPYWENAARYTEDWLALLLALSLAFVLCPIVSGVIYGVKAICYAINRGKHIIAEKGAERDEREAEKYLLNVIEESVAYSVDDIMREVQREQEEESETQEIT
ncbi:MAG: ABC transporter permease [Oscillospiraceae bacterium]|nr:ABC transporter permease [Oscillospiraceae bacterium]